MFRDIHNLANLICTNVLIKKPRFMKRFYLFSLLVLSLSILSFTNDSGRPMPKVDVKTTDGKTVNSSAFENGGKPIVISFWATWCKPCIQELTNIAEVYEDWTDETGVKIIAVSIDNARNSHKVLPLVNSKEWEYEVYIDENHNLKRAMGVGNVPHTFILDKDLNIVYSHSGYNPGDEDELYELVQKVAKGESIAH
jgi:peroxiredoxin